MAVNQHAENWVFLGDSLTEGVGSSRISHVHELGVLLRGNGIKDAVPVTVNELRLRNVDPGRFDRLVQFNVAGYMKVDSIDDSAAIWIWNLASEGQTIESDFRWLPLIATLRPSLIVIFRGSLESVIRPGMLFDGSWPAWVPHSWRSYAGMDPRCYYSSTLWRRLKQMTVDGAKQYTRKRLLRQPGKPLLQLEVLVDYYVQLLAQLRKLETRIVVLGLLPIGEEQFPRSPAYFETVNLKIHEVAKDGGAEFCDWGFTLKANGHKKLFYRDSFHPNLDGAKELAQILRAHLSNDGIVSA